MLSVREEEGEPHTEICRRRARWTLMVRRVCGCQGPGEGSLNRIAKVGGVNGGLDRSSTQVSLQQKWVQEEKKEKHQTAVGREKRQKK